MIKIFVRRGGKETGGYKYVFDATKNLETGEGKFNKTFKLITTLESDILLLAAAIYGADRCIKRGKREEYARRIELSIPVVNIGTIQPFVQKIEYILRLLSNDAWHIGLRQIPGNPESELSIQHNNGKTLLFSGGLDSLAAAIEFGSSDPHFQLVSHITRGKQTIGAQNALVSLLASMGTVLQHRNFRISGKSVPPGEDIDFSAESSQRTRSFLFLVLAALCARREGHIDIVMIAENGQMAINLPLTQGRIGAFSTHTAHPEVLYEMEIFLRGVLKIPFRIFNPYIHKTKGEVVKIIWDNLPEAIPITISCWKAERLTGSSNHCGECIPCLVRRIALDSHGTDPTDYRRDLLAETVSSLPVDDDGRRNFVDYAEFIFLMEQLTENDIMSEWPELFSPHIEPRETINMYKRATLEARSCFGKYPGLENFMR